MGKRTAFFPFVANRLHVDLPRKSATAEDAYQAFLTILGTIRLDAGHVVAERLADPAHEQALRQSLAALVERSRASGMGSAAHLRVILPVHGEDSLSRAILTAEDAAPAVPAMVDDALGDTADEGLGLDGMRAVPPTGTIIDCRGLAIRPALLPKLLDEKGRIVYSSRSVSYDLLVMGGMAIYADHPMMARDIAGRHVIEAKALRVVDGCDIVLPSEDAKRILQADRTDSILRNGRVVLLVDR